MRPRTSDEENAISVWGLLYTYLLHHISNSKHWSMGATYVPHYLEVSSSLPSSRDVLSDSGPSSADVTVHEGTVAVCTSRPNASVSIYLFLYVLPRLFLPRFSFLFIFPMGIPFPLVLMVLIYFMLLAL